MQDINNSQNNFFGSSFLKRFGYKENMNFEERQKFFNKGVSYRFIGITVTVIAMFAFIASLIVMVFLLEDGPVFPIPLLIFPFFFVGFFLYGLGNGICTLAKVGSAGFGLKFDPEQERKDKKELNKGFGGQIKDVLEAADISLKSSKTQKCFYCGAENEPHNKFCSNCGKKLDQNQAD